MELAARQMYLDSAAQYLGLITAAASPDFAVMTTTIVLPGVK
jgi:hypothetical protein